ncbi:phosphate system positive regulatory protein pho81 [Lecanora helva]
MKTSEDSRFQNLPKDVPQMLKAASDGDIDELKHLFGKGLTPLMISTDGESALCRAILSFHSPGSDHDHSEHDLSRKELMRTIDFLLESKAKEQLMLPSGCRSDKLLPLQSAASVGFVEAIRRILREGVNVDGVAEKNHLTPLYLAARGYHLDAVKLLLKHKAKIRPSPKASFADTPFHVVLSLREKEHPNIHSILACLLEADDGKDCIDSEFTFDGTPLVVAAMAGRLDCCRLLVQNGASIHATDVNGNSLLHEIARHGWFDFLKQILSQFSLQELEARSKVEYVRHMTPRELAKKNGHKQIVRLLDDRHRELKGLEKNVTGSWRLSFRLPGIK